MNDDKAGALFGAVQGEELLRWTSDLVAIPSYSGLPMQEQAVANYVVDLLQKEHIECRIQDLGQGRCNVIARLPGAGTGRSLMLNGHMDTVPAYDMSRAFEPHMKDGMLYGRGTSDMKGALSAMMGVLIAMKRTNAALSGELIFSAVADEEEGSIGTIALLESGLRADAVIVGEAMGRDAIAIAQKGLEWFEFTLHGKTVHGGRQDEGVNAIIKATRLIQVLQDQLAPRLKERCHPFMGCPTLNIGVIRGGTQLSTVAGECVVQMDRRFIPGLETYESMYRELTEIVQQLQQEDPDFRCTLKVLDSSVMKSGYVHQGMEQTEDEPLVQILKESLEEVSGKPARLTGCPCWTDAGLFGYYGKMPVVVYGPGDLTLAHSKDECLDPAALEESYKVYLSAALSFCGLSEDAPQR
ncbi:MAG TPA: acetylornithine deacetylase [Clostridiales bacterium]|nr:acetylornithine deacetylase [Clostridiales bacterium]